MKAGMLTLSSGLLVVRDEDVRSVAAAAQKEALSFLLAGGHLSLAEWAALDVVEKRAMVAAGRQFEDMKAQAVGQHAAAALRGPQEPPAEQPAAPPAPEPAPTRPHVVRDAPVAPEPAEAP